MKPGWGDTDDDWNDFDEHMEEMEDRKATDCTGWDTMNSKKQHLTCMEFRARVIDYSPTMESTMRKYMRSKLRNVIVLSDGSMYVQIAKGLWFSGRYLTGAGNSENRGILALEASMALQKCWPKWLPITMGDDCVESNKAAMDDFIQWYRAQGFLMKASDKKEFCSHEITNDGIVFQRVGKTVFRLACDPTPEHLNQVKMLFRTREQRDLIDQLAVLIAPAENDLN
jgi:hypothetical protein